MSENLHDNNAVADELITRLKITANAKRNISGDIVKYMILSADKP